MRRCFTVKVSLILKTTLIKSKETMNLTLEDQRLLEELCHEHRVSFDKVVKLLDTVREYEFKERRTGV